MIVAYLVVAWCYTCSPQGWFTGESRIETRAECEDYLKTKFHYTSSSWEAEAKDKLKAAHKPWCLPLYHPAD
jgi:hypothetical protein